MWNVVNRRKRKKRNNIRMLIKEMDFGNLELLFLISLVVVVVFFFTRCGMKCRKSNNGGEPYRKLRPFDDEMDELNDAAYSLPYAGGEIVPGGWSLPFAGGSVIGDGTYADTGLGTF